MSPEIINSFIDIVCPECEETISFNPETQEGKGQAKCSGCERNFSFNYRVEVTDIECTNEDEIDSHQELDFDDE